MFQEEDTVDGFYLIVSGVFVLKSNILSFPDTVLCSHPNDEDSQMAHKILLHSRKDIKIATIEENEIIGIEDIIVGNLKRKFSSTCESVTASCIFVNSTVLNLKNIKNSVTEMVQESINKLKRKDSKRSNIGRNITLSDASIACFEAKAESQHCRRNKILETSIEAIKTSIKHHQISKAEIESQEYLRYIECKRVENIISSNDLFKVEKENYCSHTYQSFGDSSRNRKIKEIKTTELSSKVEAPRNNIEKICKLYVDYIFYPKSTPKDNTSYKKRIDNIKANASKICLKKGKFKLSNLDKVVIEKEKIDSKEIRQNIKENRPQTSHTQFNNQLIKDEYFKLNNKKDIIDEVSNESIANRKISSHYEKLRKKLMKSSSMSEISDTSSTFKIGSMTMQSRNQNESIGSINKLHFNKSTQSSSSICNSMNRILGLKLNLFGNKKLNDNIKKAAIIDSKKEKIKYSTSCKEIKIFNFNSLPNLEEKEYWKPKELNISCRHFDQNQFKIRALRNSL